MKDNDSKIFERKLQEYSGNVKKELIKEIKEKIDLDIAILQYDNDIISYVEKEIDIAYCYEYIPEFNSFIVNNIEYGIKEEKSSEFTIAKTLGINLFIKDFFELAKVRFEVHIKICQELDIEKENEAKIKNKQIKKNNYINKFGVSYKNKYINNKKRLK